MEVRWEAWWEMPLEVERVEPRVELKGTESAGVSADPWVGVMGEKWSGLASVTE